LSTTNKSKRYNLEWVEALETKNIVEVAEMVLRAALMRTESRGAHERSDYPEEDPNWLKNIIVQKVDNKMQLSTEQVKFSYMEPKKGE
jgi:succinate dehydrogenase/fumarate reductase flavoprotein subunit